MDIASNEMFLQVRDCCALPAMTESLLDDSKSRCRSDWGRDCSVAVDPAEWKRLLHDREVVHCRVCIFPDLRHIWTF